MHVDFKEVLLKEDETYNFYDNHDIYLGVLSMAVIESEIITLIKI